MMRLKHIELNYLLNFLSVLLLFLLKSGMCLGEKTCAQLFSQENGLGNIFLLQDQEEVSNIEEERSKITSIWNVTGSVDVVPGCNLKACNETYLNGDCKNIKPGLHNIPNDNQPKSLRCRCEKACQCSDVFIRKSRCGRAYLGGGCRKCDSMYTDLFIGDSRHFPDGFGRKVTAFRVRKGCRLTVFENDEFEGDEQIIEETKENFTGIIGSYKCECNDELYVPPSRITESSSLPSYVQVPESANDLIKMLQTSEYKHHPGLREARTSYVNKRSTKNAYILVLGFTGAGKSSTINLLFDNPNITQVGDYASTTTDIQESRVRVPVDELGLNNTELRVIDTPGLGDSRGVTQDAKFLATLNNYLSTHEELSDRIPNIVLIFHKFTDNRFSGEGTNFVKMIRGLDIFRERITDENYSNVIFVFTHYCSVTKDTAEKPDERLQQFKQVIQEYSLFPRPTHVVVAENMAQVWRLPMVNGFFKLPNNEYYPKNLFEKMELVTQKGGDPIGLAVIRSAFRNSEDFVVQNFSTPTVTAADALVAKYHRALVSSNIGLVDTQITRHLAKVWNTEIHLDTRKSFPTTLLDLQKSLNLRHINTFEDIPRTTSQILTLLASLEHTQATKLLLEKALNITFPQFPENTVAGYCYNVYEDRPLPTFPFKAKKFQTSEIGFLVSESITCSVEKETKEHFREFPNKQSYIQYRLESLGISGTVPLDNFTDHVLPGHNVMDSNSTDEKWSVSAANDFRLFEFVLNNDDQLEFTSEFQDAVLSLPSFDESVEETMDKWTKFINTYGTHVVKSVYGGGSVTLKIEGNRQPITDIDEKVLLDMLKLSQDLTFDPTEEVSFNLSAEVTNQTMTFHGGKLANHVVNLGNTSRTDINKIFTEWKTSLKFYPTMLTTDVKLVPISQLVRKLGPNYEEEMERATRQLFEPHTSRDRNDTTYKVMAEELQLELRDSEMRYQNRTLELEQKQLEWEMKNAEQQLAYNRTLSEMQLEHESGRTVMENFCREKEQAWSLLHNKTEAQMKRECEQQLEAKETENDENVQKENLKHVEELANIIAEKERVHNQTILQKQLDHQAKLDESERSCKESEKTMTQEHTQKEAEIERTCSSKLEVMRNEYAEKTNELNLSHDRQMTALKAQAEQAIRLGILKQYLEDKKVITEREMYWKGALQEVVNHANDVLAKNKIKFFKLLNDCGCRFVIESSSDDSSIASSISISFGTKNEASQFDDDDDNYDE